MSPTSLLKDTIFRGKISIWRLKELAGKDHTSQVRFTLFQVRDLKYYGMEVISSITTPPTKASYKAMCERFGVQAVDVKRPSKIDLLISMWDKLIHCLKLRTIGKMTLYDGPLGKVFGGRWSDLEFSPSVTSYPACVALKAVQSITKKDALRELPYQTLKKNSYMDNVYRLAPDVVSIKKDIQEIELVSFMGEFHYKYRVISGQDVKEQLSNIVPDNVVDSLTKGLSPSKLISGSDRQDSPGWLGQLNSDWPIQQGRNDDSTDKIEQEMSRYCKKIYLLSFPMEMNGSLEENHSLDKLMYNSGTFQHLV